MYKKLIVNPLNESYCHSTFIQIGKYKVDYHPPYQLADPSYFLKGITQVLHETILFPAYFKSAVRIKKGDVVFDIGANIGTASMLFSKITGPNGRVFSFEPVMYEVINRNILLNDIHNVEVINKAVSDKEGMVEIEISDYCLDSSIVKREYKKNYYRITQIVDTVSLDIFYNKMGLEKIDFIKMDIEGAEELAIIGAKQIIRKFHPKWSISSYHIDFKNEPQHTKLVNILKKYGYKIIEKKGRYIYAW